MGKMNVQVNLWTDNYERNRGGLMSREDYMILVRNLDLTPVERTQFLKDGFLRRDGDGLVELEAFRR